MQSKLHFNREILDTLAGGKSVIDLPKLNILTESEADHFISNYGYDLKNPDQLEKLWHFHRRALVLLEEKLGFSLAEIPEEIKDPKKLKDLRKLLLWASSQHPKEAQLQRWACAFLRVMHVFTHIENDHFSSFSEEIQKQILTPFQDSLFHEGTSGQIYLKSKDPSTAADREPIALVGFEIKPFKTSSSSVIKLLAKPDYIAMNIYDKLGVRFITRSVLDSFRVLRFLVEENIVSFPHIMPDQSSNTLYPIDLFFEVAEKAKKEANRNSNLDLTQFFVEQLKNLEGQGQYLKKENLYSSDDHRFIKFIARKLIRVKWEDKREFSFFIPFEVQLMDEKSYHSQLKGPSEHQAYKERQMQAARKRVYKE